ncbi:hypothetical protein ACH4C6_15180 [Streptomyces sp. NPDC017943]|uniref:hypothetical protein n=1 Tax=Streptomyces sp. NPDC017943 TaxID=3365019 RepID=UPI0037B82E8E
MHLSGVVLLLTFLLPPLWMLDAGYAGSGSSSTGDAPFVLLLAVPVACVGLHVFVQVPAGLVGAWWGRGRSAFVRYGCAVLVAGALGLLALWSLGWGSWSSLVPAWADAMVRVSLGLAVYTWAVRARPASVRRGRLSKR